MICHPHPRQKNASMLTGYNALALVGLALYGAAVWMFSAVRSPGKPVELA